MFYDDMNVTMMMTTTVMVMITMMMFPSGYPTVNLARHRPVWLMHYEDMHETRANLVDGDTHTCSSVDQPFWAVDLGFNVAVDEVTIVPSTFAGGTLFVFNI